MSNLLHEVAMIVRLSVSESYKNAALSCTSKPETMVDVNEQHFCLFSPSLYSVIASPGFEWHSYIGKAACERVFVMEDIQKS